MPASGGVCRSLSRAASRCGGDVRVLCRVAGGGLAARRPAAGIARQHPARVRLDHVGRVQRRLHAAPRSAVGADDSGRHRHRLADSPLLDLLHARGARLRVRALLLLSESVRGVHARARARRELPGDVRRLGRRRPLLLPAHRILVSEEIGLGRRQESVHRQPHRRLRVHSRRAVDRGAVRHRRLPAGRSGAVRARPGGDVRDDFAHHAAAVHRRDRQVGADSAVRLASGRDGRSDAGVGPHPRGDDGHRRRVHDRAEMPSCSATRRRR